MDNTLKIIDRVEVVCPTCKQLDTITRFRMCPGIVTFMRRLTEPGGTDVRQLYKGDGKKSPDVYHIIDWGLVERVKRAKYVVTKNGKAFLANKLAVPEWIERRNKECVSKARRFIKCKDVK